MDITSTFQSIEDNQWIRQRLPELYKIAKLAETSQAKHDVRIEETVLVRNDKLPVYSFSFGSPDKNLPCVLFVAGIHGLERIGTHIITAYLAMIINLLEWDDVLKSSLKHCRLVFCPLVNPGGMLTKTRCNPNGVDLMRNAPVEADEKPNMRLVCGHRYSNTLPWYRGEQDEPMEKESQALCQLVERKVLSSPFVISLDLHSGYGIRDRLWFPYARSRKPFEAIAHTFAFKNLLDKTLANHIYKIEPQSSQYLAHGDLWDHLYLRHKELCHPENIFLPFSLELGSWLWIKKNPRQVFSPLGAFNPILPHRLRRSMRRHITLFDFILRAAISYKKWSPSSNSELDQIYNQAISKWYRC